MIILNSLDPILYGVRGFQLKSVYRNGSKNSTVNLSCRLDKDVYHSLSKEAFEKGISLNSLVNSMAKKFVEWDIYSSDIRLVPLSKESLEKIFNNLDDKTMQQIAKDVGGVVTRELVYLSFGEMNFENLVHAIILNASRFGTIKHEVHESKHIINIHHGICLNFSKFLFNTHTTLANDLSLKLHISNIDKNMICMEIEEK